MRSAIGPLAFLAVAGCHAKAPAPAVSPPAVGDPRHLAGLWEQTLTRDGREPPFVGRTRVCLAPNTAAELGPIAAGLRGRACEPIASRRLVDGSDRFSLRCDLGEVGVSEVFGRLITVSPGRFALVEESVTSGAAMAKLNGRHAIRIDARWLGPCLPGMKPGETTLAGGFKIDLSRAAAAARAMFGGGR